MKARGVDPGPLASYIDSFRHAVSPHAGAGIGLERVVFLYLGAFMVLLCFYDVPMATTSFVF